MSSVEREMIEGLSRLEAKFDAVIEDITDHKHILNGNGQPGLIKDVDRLKVESKKRKVRNATLIAILGANVFEILGLIVAGIKLWNRHAF